MQACVNKDVITKYLLLIDWVEGEGWMGKHLAWGQHVLTESQRFFHPARPTILDRIEREIASPCPRIRARTKTRLFSIIERGGGGGGGLNISFELPEIVAQSISIVSYDHRVLKILDLNSTWLHTSDGRVRVPCGFFRTGSPQPVRPYTPQFLLWFSIGLCERDRTGLVAMGQEMVREKSIL